MTFPSKLFSYASRVKLITNDASKNADNKEIARLKGVSQIYSVIIFGAYILYKIIQLYCIQLYNTIQLFLKKLDKLANWTNSFDPFEENPKEEILL